jgi:hypothetical protein
LDGSDSSFATPIAVLRIDGKYLARLGTRNDTSLPLPRKFRSLFVVIWNVIGINFESDDKEGFNPDNGNGDQSREYCYQHVRSHRTTAAASQPSDPPLMKSRRWDNYGYLDTLTRMNHGRTNSFFVVHQVGLQTSGVMVFARQRQVLHFYLRPGEGGIRCQKTYAFKVYDWPPAKTKNGRIDLALAPERGTSQVEGLRRCLKPVALWKVIDGSQESLPLLLDYSPLLVAHQLRIHCSTVGSGIMGDSLYGIGQAEGTTTRQNNDSI